MFRLLRKVWATMNVPSEIQSLLETSFLSQQQFSQRDDLKLQVRFFQAKSANLHNWADALKLGVERVIKELN